MIGRIIRNSRPRILGPIKEDLEEPTEMLLDGIEPGVRDRSWRRQFADHAPELRVRGSELYGSLPRSLARRRGPKRGGRNRTRLVRSRMLQIIGLATVVPRRPVSLARLGL
jgi:hypothetical protein